MRHTVFISLLFCHLSCDMVIHVSGVVFKQDRWNRSTNPMSPFGDRTEANNTKSSSTIDIRGILSKDTAKAVSLEMKFSSQVYIRPLFPPWSSLMFLAGRSHVGAAQDLRFGWSFLVYPATTLPGRLYFVLRRRSRVGFRDQQ